MAITKILHMKQAKTGYMAKHLANGLKYIMDPDKTEQGRYISGSQCIPENALRQMLDTKRCYGKLDKRQGYHFILSFEEEDISEETAFEIVGKFVQEYLGADFEAVYAIHNDTDHIHGHIIFNSVGCNPPGYKYDYKKGEWERTIQPLVNRLCEEYGLSILDMETVHEKRNRKKTGTWTEQEKEESLMSVRDTRIKRDVDRAVEDSESYEDFLEILRYMGYEIHGKKHLAVLEIGARRARRLDHLGEEYTEEMLRCRIEQPPVPKVTNGRETKIVYIYIPYQNRHLTRYQKECFIRKYRAGKLCGNPKTWEYRSNLQALKKLQEEYLFWSKYQIRSTSQLEDAIKDTEGKLRSLCEQKAESLQKKKPYLAILALWDEIMEVEMEAGLYLEGYPEFKQEYEKYECLVDKLSGLGYSVLKAQKISEYFEMERQAFEQSRRELLKEKRTARRLLDKVQLHQREKGLDQRKDTKNKGRV